MDYKKLGLKIGIEIHQQISGKKLFCRCNTNMNEENLKLEINRRLRASAGEGGIIDIAAIYEQLKDRTFIYHGYDDEFCLVDTDSEPPKEINKDALKTALEVATILKLRIPGAINPMRKIITDGSACSSFQRSMIIGRESKDSFIETSQGLVKIDLLCLEEDACKIENVKKDKVYYSLSRQGIPLLEIRTSPDIKTPEQAKEAAEKIGMILRSFPNISRGIGTIRQDLNISTSGGARVEIKGVQDLKSMPRIIENEVKRQLKGKVKSEVRKANPDGSTEYLRPMPGAARMYPESDERIIHITKDMLREIRLPELIAEKVERLIEKYKINPDIAHEIVEKKIDFKKYLRYKLKPDYIARILVEVPKEIKSRFGVKKKISENDFEEVFSYVEKGLVNKNNVIDILLEKLEKGKINVKKYKEVGDSELKKEIKKIVSKNKGVSFNGLMGEVMKRFNRVVDGKKAMKMLKETLQDK